MKFYIEYGCGCGDNYMIIEAEDLAAAENYAYEKAIEEYQSYEGLHGIMDIEEVCEEFGIEDVASAEAEIAYQEERESWLSYSAEEYDEENDEHVSALEEFGVWEI